MRHFVLALFLADTTNSIFDMVYTYNALINHFGASLCLFFLFNISTLLQRRGGYRGGQVHVGYVVW